MIHRSESVAGLIEDHLARTGKTQVALEQETGITDTHIARMRSGALPGKWVLPSLAAALGIPLADLAAMVARERKNRVVGRGGHGRGSRRKRAGRSAAKGDR